MIHELRNKMRPVIFRLVRFLVRPGSQDNQIRILQLIIDSYAQTLRQLMGTDNSFHVKLCFYDDSFNLT